jgi:acetyl-CoA synthetase
MLGHMPGLELLYDFFPQPGDVMLSPADWSWLAGLMDVLMPAWFHGVPVVVYRAPRFDAEEAFALIGRHKVRLSLLTPTTLKLMRQVPDPVRRFGVKLRAVVSGGESVGRELLDWSKRKLDAVVNEGYGQTECNIVLGHCSEVMPAKPGALGKAMPGHVAGILDDAGQPLPAGEIGMLAFRRPDPVMLLEYWRNPEATAAKYAGDWLLTGDLAQVDEDGYFWFHGRADDVITSAGYRIGPSEIEDAIVRHPAVVLAAAVGVPDAERTEIIKAFVVLREGQKGSPELAAEIQNFVRDRLAKHERPREIAFVPALPMTTTGKIMRRVLREQERERQRPAAG